MSCGCGGGCTDKIAALKSEIDVLQGRIFSLEARLNSMQGPRNPFNDYPSWVPRAGLGCPVCGVGADGKPMGYVCTNPNCPTRVTCTTTGAVGAQ